MKKDSKFNSNTKFEGYEINEDEFQIHEQAYERGGPVRIKSSEKPKNQKREEDVYMVFIKCVQINNFC